MTVHVGTWWIRSGDDDRRDEGQGFGSALNNIAGFEWKYDFGDSEVVRKDFVETADYAEKVDRVDIMFMCSHGKYDPDVSSTWGHAFATSDKKVTVSDALPWGKVDLEVFSSHACKLLYHSSKNEVWRWIPAFQNLHHMFGFHTVSHSGKDMRDRGKLFAINAAGHIAMAQIGIPWPGMSIHEAWQKANIECEDSDVKWAHLRTSGDTSAGVFYSTYNEQLQLSEPSDPISNRTFVYGNGHC